jgi:hypothetical protein
MASSGGAGLWRAGASHTLFFPHVAPQINSRNTSPGELPGTRRALESSPGRFSAGCTTPIRSRHERGRLRVGFADDPIGDDRAIGSVRRECLDHILILNGRHLQLVLDEYRGYFNTSRPHQGIDQRRPSSLDKPALGRKPPAGARVVARPVLGGLHHTYQIAA